jgi:hypothetical protein
MDVLGKFVIGFDTVCDGNQTATDEDGMPVLYDSKEEAQRELFSDALCSLEGAFDDYFEENDMNKTTILSEMNGILAEGDVEKMNEYLSKNPNCNYNNEFVEKAEDFVLGRKAIFTGQGIVIAGVKLEEL